MKNYESSQELSDGTTKKKGKNYLILFAFIPVWAFLCVWGFLSLFFFLGWENGGHRVELLISPISYVAPLIHLL